MLKNMLMELNERCEDYGMKINISKTKAMVIRRKAKKIELSAEGCSRRYGKWEECLRQKKISDDRQHYNK